MYAMSNVEGNVLKSELNLMKLFYHEALRLYGDRILMKHDLTWFMECIKQVCCNNFDCCDPNSKGDSDEREEEEKEGEGEGEPGTGPVVTSGNGTPV